MTSRSCSYRTSHRGQLEATGEAELRFRMRRPFSSFGLAVSILAGFLNRRQQDAIDYLCEENRVLHEMLGGRRHRLTDEQRKRLAIPRESPAKPQHEDERSNDRGGDSEHPPQAADEVRK